MKYPISLAAERCVRELSRGEVPKICAHLVTPWLGFAHHGLYVGDGKVIHYGALMYDVIRKPVEEVTIGAFAEGRPVYVVTHAERCLDVDESIRRARSRLGEKHYRLLSNNCEHFVEWCLHGVARSFQVDVSLAFPRYMAGRAQAWVYRVTRKLPLSQ
jgi:hypothetical protein